MNASSRCSFRGGLIFLGVIGLGILTFGARQKVFIDQDAERNGARAVLVRCPQAHAACCEGIHQAKILL